MDVSHILELINQIGIFVGVLVGFGGIVAKYIQKAKVVQILAASKELLDVVDTFEKAEADHVWTDEEYRDLGKTGVVVIKRVRPYLKKLLNK